MATFFHATGDHYSICSISAPFLMCRVSHHLPHLLSIISHHDWRHCHSHLLCSVTLTTGVTGTPVFQWEDPGVIPTPADPTTNKHMFFSVLTDTFSEIQTSQAGEYTCTISVSVILTVWSEFIPQKTLCIIIAKLSFTFLPF